MLLPRWLRRRLLRIPLQETSYARRGFHGSAPAEMRARLETIGRTFVAGYHAALDAPDAEPLAARLRADVAAELEGFAFEGAAMALALLDELSWPSGSLLRRFLEGPGAAHCYMIHVGAGWAAARLPWRRRALDRYLRQFDPLLRWLVADGYGFHQGYFDWRTHVERCAVPPRLAGYARRAFDFGLGRSLWFVAGGEPEVAAAWLRRFAPARQGDLWSGVGLAATYAGGVERRALAALVELADDHAGQLGQGAVFAAKARVLAGNLAPHTEMACDVLCGLSAAAAAALSDDCQRGLTDQPDRPAFEQWRVRIQARLAAAVAPSPAHVHP